MAGELCCLVQREGLSTQSTLVQETFVDGGVLVRMLLPVSPHHTLVGFTVPGGVTELAGIFPESKQL